MDWREQIDPKWCLASIDLQGKDFRVHYSGVFMTDPKSKRFEVSNACRFTYYEDKSAYYYDGKIVLTDHVKLIEYDLLSGEVQEYNATEYIHPICPYNAEI